MYDDRRTNYNGPYGRGFIRRPPPERPDYWYRGRDLFGEFGIHTEAVGRELLVKDGRRQGADIEQIITSVGGNQRARFETLPKIESISLSLLEELKGIAD